jgi:branched-chain amino acid transport system substrate-binding protein
MSEPTMSNQPFDRRKFLAGSAAVAGAFGLASTGFLASGAGAATGKNKLLGVTGKSLNFDCCLPISGAFTIITKPWAAAMRYACDEVNAAGGLKIAGKRIKVNSPLIDEGYAAAPATVSVDKFLAQGGHFVGGFVSEEAPVAVEGFNVNADLLVTCCINGTPALLPNKLRFFEDALAQATGGLRAHFMYNELGLRRIATIELSNSWGAAYQTTFAKAFTELGGEIVSRDYMAVTDTDFSSRISAWKPKNPDGLYIIIGDGPGTTIASQATQLGFGSLPILTEGAWDPNSYIATGKSYIDRCYYLAEYPYCHWNPEIETLAKRLWKDEKMYTTNWFWQGYDSTRMVLAAMDLAGSTDPRDVMAALPEAISNGRHKWLVKANGAVATKTKGVYLETPVWMAKFKPVTTDFLSEAPLAPVSGKQYLGAQGWMPKQWSGYTQASSAVKPPTLADLQRLHVKA